MWKWRHINPAVPVNEPHLISIPGCCRSVKLIDGLVQHVTLLRDTGFSSTSLTGQQLNTHWRDPHCGSWDQFWLATRIRSVEGLWGAPNKVDGGYIFVFEHSDLTTRCLFCGLQPVWPLNSDINAFLHAAAASRVFSLSGTVLCKPEGWLRCGENPKVF